VIYDALLYKQPEATTEVVALQYCTVLLYSSRAKEGPVHKWKTDQITRHKYKTRRFACKDKVKRARSINQDAYHTGCKG